MTRLSQFFFFKKKKKNRCDFDVPVSSHFSLHRAQMSHVKKKEISLKENQTGLLHPHFETHRGMMVKLERISGPFQAISSTVIAWNPESNCACRLKNHHPFHWNTLTLPGLSTQLLMCRRRNKLKIIGTLMEIENFRIHGQVSQDSLYWMKNHRMDLHGPGWDQQENRRTQG